MAASPSDIPMEALARAREAAGEAGRMALGYFRSGARTSADIMYKEGGSPVTEADLAVDAFLREELLRAAPDFGWLSEETADNPSRLDHRHVWVVDPIDGTRAFARGDSDWTVAIGIVCHGLPVAGFIYAPVTEEFYEAVPGGPAMLNGRTVRASGRSEVAGARVAGPRPMLDAMEALPLRFQPMPRIHSLAYRFVQVADGRLDGSMASGRANDWDLAAAHAILEAAGATVVNVSGDTPLYNRASTMHDPVVAAAPAMAQALAELMRRPALARVSGHKDSIAGV
jgi:myo-inositol-1(or 4)-monophosphatase